MHGLTARLRPIVLGALTAAGMSTVLAAPALAQATTDTQPSPTSTETEASATTENSGGDVIVTAQRREERAKDVPITLTTITADALGQGDVQQLSDIAKLTPALRFDNFGGFAQPTIRGVGTAVSASGAGSNVGIYVDGFYSPNPLTNDFQLLNVSGVTVLKGPQGTLFGRNTTGGAIQVTTSAPSQTTSGVAEVSYGRFDAQRYQGYFTAGLTDRLAFDVAGLYREGNGFVRNVVTGSKKDGAYDAWAIRAGLKFDLSDSASLLFRYSHSDTDDPTSLVTDAYVVNGQPATIGAIIPGTVTSTRRGQVSNDARTEFTSKTNSYQLTGSVDFDFGTLRSYTQYRDEQSESFLDLDSSSVSVFDVNFFITDKIFTQELILTSAGGTRFNWTVGGFYFSDKNRFRYLNGFVQGTFAGLISRSQTDTSSFAAYADGTFEAVPNLFLTAGLRYSHDQVKNGGFFLGPLGGGLGFIGIPDIKDDRVTPRAVVRYKPNPDSSVYASFSMGHKAGIENPNGFTTVPVDPEKITAYEVGYKYAARGLSFDASAYYYDYKDLQVASYNGTQALINNAANSRVYGIEGQISYQFTSQFQANVAAGYTNGKYKTYEGSPAFFQCLDPVACGAGFGTFPTSRVDASGFRMARTPRFSGNVGARYAVDLGGGEFALSGNLAYTSKVFFDSSQQFSTDGYELLSLRAEWTDPSDRFTLAVYGDNVTDSTYYTQILPGQFAIQTVFGTPATWGVSGRVKF